MSPRQIAEDLDYVRTLAEAGRAAPPVGGRFMVLWGLLVPAVMATHWAIVTGRLDIPPQALLWMWIGMGVGGGLVSGLIGRAVDKAPGASAANNRMSSAVWGAMPLALTASFVGIFSAIQFLDAPLLLWNIIPGIALTLYGASYLAVSFFQKSGLGVFSGVASLITAAACFALLERADIYLIAAVGIVVSTLIPGLIAWAREPKLTV